MLAAEGVRWLTRRPSQRDLVVIEHEHDHAHDALHDHEHADPRMPASSVVVETKTHTHVHKHVATLPSDPFGTYSAPGAVGVGLVHGIGAETPSQVLLFVSAAGASTSASGFAALISFIAGLVMANVVIAAAALYGFSRARSPRVYLAIALITAAFSLALGTAYVTGRADVVPGLFGF